MATREDRIRKVIALLNLAENNSSEHQGQMAAQAAREMMAKYSITDEDINSAEYKNVVFRLEYKTSPMWYRRVWYDIGELLGCYVVYLQTPTGVNDAFHVCGPEEEIIHLEYIARALHGQINALSYQYFYDKPDMTRAERMPYRNGLAVRAIERIHEIVERYYNNSGLGAESMFEDNMRADTDKSDALMIINNKVAASQERSDMNGKTETVTTTIRRDGPGYLDGLMDGDKLSVNRGVGGSAASTPKQLN